MGTSTEQNTLNIRQEEKNKRDHRTEKGPMGTSTEQNTLNIRQEEKNKRDHRTEKGPMGTSIEQNTLNIRQEEKANGAIGQKKDRWAHQQNKTR